MSKVKGNVKKGGDIKEEEWKGRTIKERNKKNGRREEQK